MSSNPPIEGFLPTALTVGPQEGQGALRAGGGWRGARGARRFFFGEAGAAGRFFLVRRLQRETREAESRQFFLGVGKPKQHAGACFLQGRSPPTKRRVTHVNIHFFVATPKNKDIQRPFFLTVDARSQAHFFFWLREKRTPRGSVYFSSRSANMGRKSCNMSRGGHPPAANLSQDVVTVRLPSEMVCERTCRLVGSNFAGSKKRACDTLTFCMPTQPWHPTHPS